ncbi:MAG: ATP-binding cassette domain-containing protein [Nitrososphaerota archaeon]|nr:ATP-binding cassette domain-containing protein [Candidatus Calditenuaceae archaeon]MDW8073376.1 ATP-binding cassette domain-containing protein [Nitrososphaerota archaeon]
MKAVEVSRLRKVFGEIVAVDDVSFYVDEGEVFGFLGPNGAGKTTTINMLTTLLKPSSGSAKVWGFDIESEPERVREVIGLVPQELTVDDELTGYENMMLQAALYHVGREDTRRKSREILEFLELEKFAHKKVETYSGGMKKRLEIGCALLHEPRILFLDEPTLGLDVQTRAAIWSYIKSLVREKGVTIFMTTHYMDEADSVCDRVAIIDYGKIRAVDTPNNLKSSIGGDLVELEVSEPNGQFGESLRVLPGVLDVDMNGAHLVIKALRGEEALPAIISMLVRSGVDIRRVEMKRPSLEEVFLSLMGRKLRDFEGSREEVMKRSMTLRRMRK